jgi:hypothetical protein
MQLKDLFKKEGYSTVALPSDDLEALQMLLIDSDGSLSRLGSADKIMRLFEPDENATPLSVKKDVTVANITGSITLTSELKANIGLMESLAAKIGVEFGAGVERNSDDQLLFMFESPKKDAISSFFDLDDYLNSSKLIPNTYSDKLKDGELYIITAVLKSSKFAIGLVDKSNLGAALELPSIKDFVEGHITYGRGSSKQRVIQYEGDKSLVFGVQAAKVFYNRTMWQKIVGEKGVFRVVNTEGVLVKSADEDIKVTLLQGQNLNL